MLLYDGGSAAFGQAEADERPTAGVLGAKGGSAMEYIDVTIPAIIGLLAILRPQVAFVGSRASPDERRLRLMRRVGVALLAVSGLYSR